MKRRNFIQKSALLSTGMAIMPELLSGKPNDEFVFGHNQKKYVLDTSWGNLNNTPVKDCHEMVQDQKGRILLLTNETRNNIIIYDKKGKLIDTWGHEFPGGHGLTLFNENGEDFLFITDTEKHQVYKTTLSGRVILSINYPKEIEAYSKVEDFVPTETCIAPNGDIYIADGYGKDFIMHYNAKGELQNYFGGRGNEPKNLKNAHGICWDSRNKANPTLIVTSREENAFKQFTPKGEYLNTIAIPGAWVCRPVIKDEYLYAAVLQSNSKQWSQSGFVVVLDKNNKVISNIGGNEPIYSENKLQELYQTIKAFQYPHDVCIDDENNVYVAQWNSGHVYPYKLKPVN